MRKLCIVFLCLGMIAFSACGSKTSFSSVEEKRATTGEGNTVEEKEEESENINQEAGQEELKYYLPDQFFYNQESVKIHDYTVAVKGYQISESLDEIDHLSDFGESEGDFEMINLDFEIEKLGFIVVEYEITNNTDQVKTISVGGDLSRLYARVDGDLENKFADKKIVSANNGECLFDQNTYDYESDKYYWLYLKAGETKTIHVLTNFDLIYKNQPIYCELFAGIKRFDELTLKSADQTDGDIKFLLVKDGQGE